MFEGEKYTQILSAKHIFIEIDRCLRVGVFVLMINVIMVTCPFILYQFEDLDLNIWSKLPSHLQIWSPVDWLISILTYIKFEYRLCGVR